MDTNQIKQVFLSPSVEYRGKPFWSWNGELRGEELVRQAHIMKEMGLGGYFMHSRAGLITEYLGEEWFDLINEVADAAEADGMEAWLYDEDRWPSGSAGGKVTVDPQYRCSWSWEHRVRWQSEEPSTHPAREHRHSAAPQQPPRPCEQHTHGNRRSRYPAPCMYRG